MARTLSGDRLAPSLPERRPARSRAAQVPTTSPEHTLSSAGTIHGLVICQAMHDELGLGGNYVEFQSGYLWIPYRGEQLSTLTAD